MGYKTTPYALLLLLKERTTIEQSPACSLAETAALLVLASAALLAGKPA
jgi:hypothetical protein